MIGFVHIKTNDIDDTARTITLHWSTIKVIKELRAAVDGEPLTFLIHGDDRRDRIYTTESHADIFAKATAAQREDIAMRRELRMLEAA